MPLLVCAHSPQFNIHIKYITIVFMCNCNANGPILAPIPCHGKYQIQSITNTKSKNPNEHFKSIV